MDDLRSYYDAALAAEAEVQRVKTEMDEAFNSGGDEGKLKALEMRPALDKAMQDAKAANDLYISRREAAQMTGNVAARFTPAPIPDAEPDEKKGKAMKRAEFNALPYAERSAFMRTGGALAD